MAKGASGFLSSSVIRSLRNFVSQLPTVITFSFLSYLSPASPDRKNCLVDQYHYSTFSLKPNFFPKRTRLFSRDDEVAGGFCRSWHGLALLSNCQKNSAKQQKVAITRPVFY